MNLTYIVFLFSIVFGGAGGDGQGGLYTLIKAYLTYKPTP